MNNIMEAIVGELGPGALANISKQLGAPQQQTQQAIAVALPAMISALSKNASKPEGAQALASALSNNHTPNMMETLGPLAGALLGGQGGGGGMGAIGGLLGGLLGGGVAPKQPSGSDLLGGLLSSLASGNTAGLPKSLDGAGILGHMFGAAQPQVANQVSKSSGLDMGIVMKLLPVLAPIVMNALGSMKAKNNLDAGGLGQMLQQETQSVNAGGLASMFDAKGDGVGADDLMKIGGQLLQSGALGKLFG